MCVRKSRGSLDEKMKGCPDEKGIEKVCMFGYVCVCVERERERERE